MENKSDFGVATKVASIDCFMQLRVSHVHHCSNSDARRLQPVFARVKTWVVVTTSELCRRLGVERTTLGRWIRLGLVGKLRVGPHPSGQGRTSFFDNEQVARALAVKDLVRAGYGLEFLVKRKDELISLANELKGT